MIANDNVLARNSGKRGLITKGINNGADQSRIAELAFDRKLSNRIEFHAKKYLPNTTEPLGAREPSKIIVYAGSQLGDDRANHREEK